MNQLFRVRFFKTLRNNNNNLQFFKAMMEIIAQNGKIERI